MNPNTKRWKYFFLPNTVSRTSDSLFLNVLQMMKPGNVRRNSEIKQNIKMLCFPLADLNTFCVHPVALCIPQTSLGVSKSRQET